ncbi:PAS domain-containing sensor histidine kinase [Clostridium hydrogeniformans]|uniref:PAS domain-containing sensor histidine kinase n=1 Tax=Clostridium hydrogeniformans TaxID=349933 RepID=UPI00068EA05C|nr:PAS domain-containing sensor histidine kinase [Clostridium hydrogeniformans]
MGALEIPVLISIWSSVLMYLVFIYINMIKKDKFLEWGKKIIIFRILAHFITIAIVYGWIEENSTFVFFRGAFNIVSYNILIYLINEFFYKAFPTWKKNIFYIMYILAFMALIVQSKTQCLIDITVFIMGVLFLYEGLRLRRRKISSNIIKNFIITLIFGGFYFIIFSIFALNKKYLPVLYILSISCQVKFFIELGLLSLEKMYIDILDLEQSVKHKESRLQDIISSQRDIIFEVDRYGKFTFVSEAAIEILGYKSEDMRGEHIENFIDIDFQKYFFAGDERYFDVEVIGKSCNNDNINLRMSFKNKIGYYNSFNGAIGSIKDITEKNRMEKVIEDEKYKIEFFTNVSHDIKTPLNVINSSIQMLEQKNIKESKREEYIGIIKNNTFRLIKLLNNLIDLSKIESGYYDLNKQQGNIVYTVENICDSLIPYIKSKNIDFIFDTEEEEIITIFDEDVIERVMLNLISNAVKFTNNNGKIKVYIKKKKENVIISVKDNGIGISESKLDTIFDRYVKAHNTCGHYGNGVGLSIVKSFVELHNGSIKVSSKENKGTKFIITLPIILS